MTDRSCPDLLGRDCDGFPNHSARSEPGPGPLPPVQSSGERERGPVPVLRDRGGLSAFEAKVLSEPGAPERVAEIESELRQAANLLVDGDRQAEYGPPEQNMRRIGEAWAAVLNLPEPIPGWKVALMLAAMKVVRAAQTPSTDSLTDLVGYAEIVRRIRPRDAMWVDGGLVFREPD